MSLVAPARDEAVRFAGGLQFDRVMAGWDVTVLTSDHGDPRPLVILGARVRDLDTMLKVPIFGPCLEAVALGAALYESDARVRALVTAAAEAGKAKVRFWAETVPAGPADRLVRHRLSLAARALKVQAMRAAHATVPVEDTEVFFARVPGALGTRRV
jgi:hypothetical protein